MKIKIIDLIVKVANQDELPKKIKYGEIIYLLNVNKTNYLGEEDKNRILFDEDLFAFCDLNNEVEIIEEDKKIEKLNDKLGVFGDNNMQKIINELNYTRTIINELIDEMNKLKESK